MAVPIEVEQILETIVQSFSLVLDNLFALLQSDSTNTAALAEANSVITQLQAKIDGTGAEISSAISDKLGTLLERATELNSQVLAATAPTAE